MVIACVLALVALFPTTGGQELFGQVPPSYGDITIWNSYVIMSLSVDFKYNPRKIAYFCGTNDQDHIRYVLSRQFGYDKDGCHFLNKRPDGGFGITCDDCTGHESHALHCCSITTNLVCGEVLALDGTCKGSKRQFSDYGSHPSYPGEVLLFPPVTQLSPSAPTSYSMGLVAVRKECKDSHEWRFVRKDTEVVSMTVVNTLCRQMGFTYGNPGFVVTLDEAKEFYQYNFTLWEDIMGYSEVLTSDVECSRSQRCLGCCKYSTYPSNKCTYKDAIQERLFTDHSQYLVIRCSFYQDKVLPPSGDIGCSVIDNIQDNSSCYPSNHFDDVRLQGSNSVGRNPNQGRLEYFRNYEWHTVCYADFNQTEADVACRMLGFSSAKAFQKYQDNGADKLKSTGGPPLSFSCSDNHASDCSFIISNCNHTLEIVCEKLHPTSWYLQVIVLPCVLGIMVLILGMCTILLCLKCCLKCCLLNRQGGYENLEQGDPGCQICFRERPRNEDAD